jgi:hypothetical protein
VAVQIPDALRTFKQPPPATLNAKSAWAAWRRRQRGLDRLERALFAPWRAGFHPAWSAHAGCDFAALERLAEAGGGSLLKPGPGARVLRIKSDAAVIGKDFGPTLVLKHYPPTRRADPRDACGRSKAARCVLAAHALIRRGFDVARPLAAWSGPGRGSWLLMEDLAGFVPLHRAAADCRGTAREQLLRAVAQCVRRLHASGVAFRDLKPSNLLVREAHGRWDLALVDHDRNWFFRWPAPAALARRDVAALHAGLPPEVRAAERARALSAYDPRWLERGTWRRQVRPLLREAARRRHRWIPRRLLGGA